MWAVGCVTVVLLTGGLAFCDPVTNAYSGKLARECNLEFLRQSNEWQAVRQRPKEFVEKLLVLEENARMTAEEALQHPWFFNEVHKNDFEDLYQRTIKHWQPRISKSQIVDFQDSGFIRSLECSQAFRDTSRRSSPRVQLPVESPYKPFPRNLHLRLWPKRNPNDRLSKEVLSALENWSPQSAASLRIKAGLLSPTLRISAFPSTNPASIGHSRHARASSEPPLDRFSILSGRKSIDGDSRNPLIADARIEDEQQHRAKTDSVSRPSTPRRRRGIIGGQPRAACIINLFDFTELPCQCRRIRLCTYVRGLKSRY